MNNLAEHFIFKRLRKKWQRKHKGTNIHHREAVKNGGKGWAGNLVRVQKKAHAAYHAFLGTKTPQQIVRYLNQFWLPLRVTIVLIPTNRLTESVKVLEQLGILSSADIREYGVTHEHLRFHGTPDEQHIFAEMHREENKRRPE